MAKWTMKDGTTVTSDGVVAGDSHVSSLISGGLSLLAKGCPPYVDIVPPPSGGVPLRLDDWLLDRWLRGIAKRHELTITTDFDSSAAPIPDDAQELLNEAAQWLKDDAGAVY